MKRYGVVQVQFFIGEDKEESNLKLYDQVMRNMDLMPKNAMQPIIKTMDIDTGIPIAKELSILQCKKMELIFSKVKLFTEVSLISKRDKQNKRCCYG